MNLGAWQGRHQAFGMVAKRCSAADAECLKAIRDGGRYKQLGLTWEQFCNKYGGVSRVHAKRQIHYLEEFGERPPRHLRQGWGMVNGVVGNLSTAAHSYVQGL